MNDKSDPARGQATLHARSRSKGVNPIVYWLARAFLQPCFHVYFRMSRSGREHLPASAPRSVRVTVEDMARTVTSSLRAGN